MLTANQIKELALLKQKKFRQQYKKFLIEGFHLIEECLDSSFNLEYILLRNDVSLSQYSGLKEKVSLKTVKIEILKENAFNKIAETENSQGIIGVVSKPEGRLHQNPGDLIIALDRISDPGNLGTIIRTAYWFNVKLILLSFGSADPFNSKVIRSSQGAVFHTDIAEKTDLLKDLRILKSQGYNIILFTLDTKNLLGDINDAGKAVLVFGSESQGLSEELLSADFNKMKIPGFSDCDSLNVAISCGIALYEFCNNRG